MNRSAREIGAGMAFGLLAACCIAPHAERAKAVGWLLDVGRRDPLASPVPSLIAGVWLHGH